MNVVVKFVFLGGWGGGILSVEFCSGVNFEYFGEFCSFVFCFSCCFYSVGFFVVSVLF